MRDEILDSSVQNIKDVLCVKDALSRVVSILRARHNAESSTSKHNSAESSERLDAGDSADFAPDSASLDSAFLDSASSKDLAPDSACVNSAFRPRLEAEILLAFVLDKPRVWLHAHDTQALSSDDWQRFLALIHKRAESYPIEYLTKRASFWDMELFVDEGALIPRPESEILVQKVCEVLREHILRHTLHDADSSVDSSADFATKPALARHITRIVEVGAGSGALSIAIARSVAFARIIATDISQDALNIAARNVADFGLQERIELVRAPFLGDIDMSGIDLVFSNPPYIAASYALPRNVAFEPISALVGGERGSEVLEELIARCANARIKWLVCEMGYDQKPIMQQVLSLHGYKAEFYKDLAGLDRGFVAQLII